MQGNALGNDKYVTADRSVTYYAEYIKTSYGYTGGVQIFKAPKTGYYTIELYGARSGAQRGGQAATYGDYVKGTVKIQGGTTLYIYVGGIYYLPYPDGHAEVTNKALGYDTGDAERTARAVAAEVGVDEVVAGVLPDQKEEKVRVLQADGSKVAMVGDGINDAPALARADVGIAIGAGTDIAIESADIVLMRSDLSDAANAIELSRATMRTIRQNLFWALFYNAICIPVAAGVLAPWGITLNPMIGAAAMGFSSVFVVTNALRLRLWKPSESVIRGVSPDEGKKEEAMRNVELTIEGMHCMKCVAKTKAALEAVPGVRNVEVSLEEGRATLEAGMVANNAKLIAAVEGAGFKAAVADPANHAGGGAF